MEQPSTPIQPEFIPQPIQSNLKSPSSSVWKILVLILTVGIISVGSIAYYFWQKTVHTIPTVSQATPTIESPLPASTIPTPSSAPLGLVEMDNWSTYNGSEYTFKHPIGLKSDTGAAGISMESIRFQFMGPKQVSSGRTQTSLFDGYAFVVIKIGPTALKTSQQAAQEARSNAVENCGAQVIQSPLKQVNLAQFTGLQYTVENCLGDYTTTYVDYADSVYQIIQLYVGEKEDQALYKEITNQIFSTFSFIPIK